MNQKRNEVLIAQRKKRNLFQEQVANAVRISIRNYQNIEAGECKPNVETAISIAEFLDADVTDLFGPQRQLRKNKPQENSNTEKAAPEIPSALAAAELSEVPSSEMVAASFDFEDGHADTETGKKVLGLMRAVGGPALG